MTYEDYIRYFTTFEICKVKDDYLYTSTPLKHLAPNHHSFVTFMITDEGEYYFTICQKDRRQFHNT